MSSSRVSMATMEQLISVQIWSIMSSAGRLYELNPGRDLLLKIIPFSHVAYTLIPVDALKNKWVPLNGLSIMIPCAHSSQLLSAFLTLRSGWHAGCWLASWLAVWLEEAILGCRGGRDG